MFKITKNWYEILREEFSKGYYKELSAFLAREYETHKIYPPAENVFNALNNVKFDSVRVVLIGQDPYHGANQAHGLCFSVEGAVPPPPSLVNIFKELQDDLGMKIPKSGNLTKWARQGVLMLNSVLTVREGQPNSHKGKGWEQLTTAIIEKLNARKEPIVFLLWGANAKEIGKMVTSPQHKCLYAAHPSPLSAHNGFMGCKHFSETNAYLREWGMPEIDWGLE